MEIVLTIFGLGAFLLFFFWGWSSKAFRWRELSAAYGVSNMPPARATKNMQSIIVFDKGILFTSYHGSVKISISDGGIGFKMMPIFAWLHPPFFIPAGDLKVRQADWYLNAASFELLPAKTPDMRIVIDSDLMGWISENLPELGPDTIRRW